eukprot:1159306-Pelagomonas_calceolata.AAC.21
MQSPIDSSLLFSWGGTPAPKEELQAHGCMRLNRHGRLQGACKARKYKYMHVNAHKNVPAP